MTNVQKYGRSVLVLSLVFGSFFPHQASYGFSLKNIVKKIPVVRNIPKIPKVAGNIVEGTGNVLKAGGHLVTGNSDKAKDDLKKAEKSYKEAGKSTAKIATDTAKDATLAPTKAVFSAVDTFVGSHLKESLDKRKEKTSKEIHKASKKMGAVLEVAAKPKNLAKIALLYTASTVAGPFGSALANVLYDKIILKQSMSNRDMLKSFAIGAAAGYASEGMQSFVEGEQVFDLTKQASYLSKTASGLAQNLTTDAGNVLINHDHYTSRDFLASVLTSAANVKIGNAASDKILESTIDGAFKNATNQIVENDFNLKEIDFDQVEMGLYKGLADGITRESVHKLMDKALIEALPEEGKRLDLKAANALADLFYEALVAYQKYSEEQEQILILQSFFVLDKKEQANLLEAIKRRNEEFKDFLAHEIYGKKFSELSSKEVASSKFQKAYEERLLKLGEELYKNNPSFSALVNRSVLYTRIAQTGGAAEALELLAQVTEKTAPETLKLIQGGLGAEISSAALNLSILKIIGNLGLLLYAPEVGQNSDQILLTFVEADSLGHPALPKLFPPNPADYEGWGLYLRALRGDQTAKLIYLNREKFEKSVYSRGILEFAQTNKFKTKEGLEILTILYLKMQKFPSHLQVARVREGTDINKIAVIGRSMKMIVTKAKEEFEGSSVGNNIKVEIFEPSEEAKLEFKQLTEGDRVLTTEEMQKTKAFFENKAWAKKLRDKNYTVIDMKITGGLKDNSVFYRMEKELLFSDKR